MGLIASRLNITRVFGRKMRRKIYGTIVDNDEYRRRLNQELYELNPDIDLVKRIELGRLCWLDDFSGMDIDESARKVFEDVLEGCH